MLSGKSNASEEIEAALDELNGAAFAMSTETMCVPIGVWENAMRFLEQSQSKESVMEETRNAAAEQANKTSQKIYMLEGLARNHELEATALREYANFLKSQTK